MYLIFRPFNVNIKCLPTAALGVILTLSIFCPTPHPPLAWLCICTKRIQIVLLIGWLTKSDCCNFPGKGAALKKVERETHNNRTELKAQKMKMKTRIHGLLLHRVKSLSVFHVSSLQRRQHSPVSVQVSLRERHQCPIQSQEVSSDQRQIFPMVHLGSSRPLMF